MSRASRGRSGSSFRNLRRFFTASGMNGSRTMPPSGWATCIRVRTSPSLPPILPEVFVPALSFCATRSAISLSHAAFFTSVTPSVVVHDSCNNSTSPDLRMESSFAFVSTSKSSGFMMSILLITTNTSLLAKRGLIL